MNIECVAGTAIKTELTDRLEERKRLDVTNGTPNLDDCDIGIFHVRKDLRFNLIGDMGDDLNRTAQVVATAFFVNDREVDLAGGEVTLFREARIGVALIMTQIQISFCAIVGYEHFAMLKRRHGAGVNVNVRVKLLHGDSQATGFQ